jgi:hypothetical protein
VGAGILGVCVRGPSQLIRSSVRCYGCVIDANITTTHVSARASTVSRGIADPGACQFYFESMQVRVFAFIWQVLCGKVGMCCVARGGCAWCWRAGADFVGVSVYIVRVYPASAGTTQKLGGGVVSGVHRHRWRDSGVQERR